MDLAPAPIQHIEMLNGHAMIAGRHLKAKVVAGMVVRSGRDIEEVMRYYDLTRAEVHAALVYYYDNQDWIERELAETEAYVKQHGRDIAEVNAMLRARLEGK